MKSWWIRTAGAEMSLDMRDVPVPQPGPGQVGIRIRAAALNRGEFIAGHGLHTAATARPAGFEAAGEVTALDDLRTLRDALEIAARHSLTPHARTPFPFAPVRLSPSSARTASA